MAIILIVPGSCDRDRSVVFGLRARAGWLHRGIAISGVLCKNGSGQVAVGSFHLVRR